MVDGFSQETMDLRLGRYLVVILCKVDSVVMKRAARHNLLQQVYFFVCLHTDL